MKHKHMLVDAALQQSSDKYQSQLANYEKAFERIKNATGISEPSEIFNKFINREEEEANLIQQKEM